HDLVVARHAAADLAVRRVRGEAACVTDLCRIHTRRLPEFLLGAPEAAHAEHGELHPVGEWLAHARAEDDVPLCDGHRVAASRKSFGLARDPRLLLVRKPHDDLTSGKSI